MRGRGADATGPLRHRSVPVLNNRNMFLCMECPCPPPTWASDGSASLIRRDAEPAATSPAAAGFFLSMHLVVPAWTRCRRIDTVRDIAGTDAGRKFPTGRD